MNKLSKTLDFLLAIRSDPKIVLGRKQYLFIVSHMRSYSSLLAHILGSHAEISGYAEMHQSYTNRWDLLKLRYKVYRINGKHLDGRFVLDKILHNNHRISDSLLNNSNFAFIFLLRKPEETLKSIMRMHLKKRADDPERLSRKSLSYYCQRLEELQNYASIAKENGVFVESEQLTDNPDNLLCSLTNWLGLEQQLSASYSTFEYTGVPVYGDSSEHIQSGVIKKGGANCDGLHVPCEVLSQAEIGYQECRRAMSMNCACLAE